MLGDLSMFAERVKEGRGKRHPIKTRRWEVASDPDGALKGTWLGEEVAKLMLAAGDFYLDGTKIYMPHLGVTKTVKGTQLV